MLKKLFGKKENTEKVFIIPFHVKPLENSIMPPELGGAYVSCYATGETYVEATEKALQKLAEDGLHPEEILQPINEMLASDWSVHINEQWKDYVSNLPTQSEFEASIISGKVVYGPFGSYNPD
ncbi:hypothetical protein KUV22_17090 [Microbulbifer agarilyticus]|uniref:hypothetical protein n=1 Tax=Microbulbifer agarilyticus TaxID=260552 RepID=UPI001C937B20|nr:hypothetical protein [Microbulbifer agarilyticus]MBY6192140.1 hypothetical protein [Microbulbifer agarilyticus]